MVMPAPKSLLLSPLANPTPPQVNLTSLAMTAQFYRQSALSEPNLTPPHPNLTPPWTTLQ